MHKLYISFIYMYTKAILLSSIKAWERTSEKRKYGETGKQTKWNGSTEYEIEKSETK